MTPRQYASELAEPARRGARRYARDQRVRISHVLRVSVIVLVIEPVAAPAARHIRTHDAAFVRQRLREKIEIAAVARQAMHADDNAPVRRVAPVSIGNLVKAVGGQAEESFSAHDGNRYG